MHCKRKRNHHTGVGGEILLPVRTPCCREHMRIGLEIEVSDKELLGRLANVKEKKEALDRAMAQLESCITSRYEAKKHIAKETYRPALFEAAEEKKP